jgi:hypothetical protein
MASRQRRDSDKPRRPPAKSPEEQENRMISLANSLAERQLEEGTASAQVITHYLKLGSSRERLEQEKLHRENELLEAKAEVMASARRVEELYATALDAMRTYAGQIVDHEDDYED